MKLLKPWKILILFSLKADLWIWSYIQISNTFFTKSVLYICRNICLKKQLNQKSLLRYLLTYNNFHLILRHASKIFFYADFYSHGLVKNAIDFPTFLHYSCMLPYNFIPFVHPIYPIIPVDTPYIGVIIYAKFNHRRVLLSD